MALWQARYRNFRFITTLTRENGGDYQGRVTELLPGVFPDLTDYSIYIAGSTAFVEDCIDTVKSLGAREELLHTEGFHRQQSPESPPAGRLMT
jgi:CDP-4-dehydro-6-deoxyglucose reductase